MPDSLISIFVTAILAIVFSPIYFQRRKLWRMADEDLKRIDSEEWKKQLKANAYINLGSRVIWGLFSLLGFILSFQRAVAQGFSTTAFIVPILGIAFIIWGIIGFRKEINKIHSIE